MSESDIPEDVTQEEKPATFSVFYSCMRCGTRVSQSELTRLPEIKCICGFRVFTKVRAPLVKTIKTF
jgi:DNA-directed RNA polymerase subunit P